MADGRVSRSLKGMAAAPGLARGPLFIWKAVELTLPVSYPCDDPEKAWLRIQSAIQVVKQDLVTTRDQVIAEVGAAEAEIFDAHLMMLEDVALHEMVQAALQQGANPEQAWHDSISQFAGLLESLPDETLRARAADVRDVGRQVLVSLLGVGEERPDLVEPVVIVARDLSPSQTVRLDTSKVLAFCTSEGGPTSHTAILAKALGIPALVAIGADIHGLQTGQTALVDAERGVLITNPTPEELLEFATRQQRLAAQFQQDLSQTHEAAISKDGVRFEVFANVGNAHDVVLALANGAEGVGLFRTELLFLDRKAMPTLGEQVGTYRRVIDALNGRPLVVRSLDIGGDKTVEYLGIREEPNPFLGWRAIRMINERPEILEEQFYALLLAGEGTDLRIMIPMVSQVKEVVGARALLQKARLRIESQNPAYQVNLQFGIMVEVPSAALMIEHFAPYVDFFSIGTNDLTQYTLAVDRMNARVANLASPYNPAVLKLIERTIRVAHEHGKWVGMCGEFAGSPAAIPFLMGVGLDEFSMSPLAIPQAKRMIRQLTVHACQEIARHTLSLATAEDVETFLGDSLLN